MLFARSGDDEVVMVVLIVCAIITFAASLAIHILFLLTLKRAFEQCSPRARTMEPGQVFLNLIPLFGFVWIFITVSRLSESLRNEFDDRRIDAPGDYGQNLGISYAALTASTIIPYVGTLTGIAGFICWILYWVKIAEYSRQLREGDSFRDEDDRPSRRRSRDDDEYDDRPSRRHRDEDDEDDRPRRRYD